MVDTFDIMPSLLYFQNYESETNVATRLEGYLEGYLSVKKGVTYTFCISSGNEVRLRIDSRLRMVANNNFLNTARKQCHDVLAANTELMVTVEYTWTKKDLDLPVVLQWKYPEEPQAIIPSSAWVQVRKKHTLDHVQLSSNHK